MADMFSEALVHHRAGRLDLAGSLYRAVLADRPQHADSLNLMGVLAHQTGDASQAIELISQALRLRADGPPLSLLEIDYERLVEDQERESRRLIAGLGLDWDPSCLGFHKTERAVHTASATQVRQPMYARSVGRWRRYEAALEPFLRAIEN